MTFGSTFGRTFSPTFQPKSQAAAGGVVVYDTFTDTDATLLSAHTPDICPSGSTWSNGVIYSNRAQMPSDGYGVIESGISDCVITADILSSYTASGIEARQNGIVFRHNGTNFWKVTANASTNTFYILNPSGTIVVSTSVTINQGVLLAFVVTLSGNSITATLNGSTTINYSSDVNVTATKHGFWLFRRTVSPYCYCDNYKIEI